MLEVWKTGVTYQMFHAGGLFVVALLMDKVQSSLLTTAGWLMVAGIIMFSGSLYALSTTGIKFFTNYTSWWCSVYCGVDSSRDCSCKRIIKTKAGICQLFMVLEYKLLVD